jgi:hypothetical protein
MRLEKVKDELCIPPASEEQRDSERPSMPSRVVASHNVTELPTTVAAVR